MYDDCMTTTTENRITVQEGRERLEAALRTLTSEDAWKSLLRLKSMQHSYSLNNILLASMQCPDISMIGGAKNFWQPLGRYPQKGSKALRIFAPMIAKKKDGTEGTFLLGFKLVPVFDVSQTDGEPLPEVTTAELGDAPDRLCEALLDFATSEGLTVEYSKMPAGVGGHVTIPLKAIALNEDEGGLKRVKTLAHELAHWLDRDELKIGSTPLNEVVAESVAYIVGMAAGADTSDYSIGYVAIWGDRDGDPIEAVKKVTKRVDAAANKLLKVIDNWKAARLAEVAA